jgi:hypothetical protein
VVPRHGEDQEEDVVFVFFRRFEKSARRCPEIHSGKFHLQYLYSKLTAYKYFLHFIRQPICRKLLNPQWKKSFAPPTGSERLGANYKFNGKRKPFNQMVLLPQKCGLILFFGCWY